MISKEIIITIHFTTKHHYIHKLAVFHDTWHHHCDNGNPLHFYASQLAVIDSINTALI